MPIEKEFKWRAVSEADFELMLRAARARFDGEITGPEELHIKDAYLDSPDERFSARKTALRLRCTDGAFEATLKAKTRLVNGQAVRWEETVPLPHAGNEVHALRALRDMGEWDGLALRDVNIRFYIFNRRRIYRLCCASAEYELAFDDVRVEAASRVLRMKEVELELKRGTDETFRAFAAVLGEISGLTAPEKSKVQTATELLNGGNE